MREQRLRRRSRERQGDKLLRILIVEDSEIDALLLLRNMRRGVYEP